jgi:hypothetical protein
VRRNSADALHSEMSHFTTGSVRKATPGRFSTNLDTDAGIPVVAPPLAPYPLGASGIEGRDAFSYAVSSASRPILRSFCSRISSTSAWSKRGWPSTSIETRPAFASSITPAASSSHVRSPSSRRMIA